MTKKIAEERTSRIVNLRKKGFSIPEISRVTNTPKSTVSRYVRGITISKKYQQRLAQRRNASKITSEKNWLLAAKFSEEVIKDLSNKDSAILASALYWAEGAKKDFSFSNTDPKMIRVFVNVLRRTFGVANQDLKVSIRTYEDLNKIACIKFWSKVTEVKISTNNVNVLKGYKKGKLRYGMCRIRVRKGGLLLKKIFSIINRLYNLSSPL